MSCPTFKVSVGIPVFGLGFTGSNQLIIGGGGGAGRSGVKNKLCSYKVDVRRKDLEEDATFDFGPGEDAPMCLDVHPELPIVVAGVNSTEENIAKGENENCRTFKIKSDKIELEKAINTLESKKAEDYQRVTRFSQDGTLVAVGTTDGKVDVFKYPEFESISSPITVSKDDEVLDVDINLEKEKLTCVLRDGLKLINLRGKNVGQVVQTISTAQIVKNTKTNFRAFRYGRGFSKDFGFAALNGTTKPGAYIVKYDAYSLEQVKVTKVGSKPITAFAISPDGALLAIACADLSISLHDTQTLKTLTKIKDAHSFSITCIAISPDRRLLASASADNSCRIVSLPLQFSNSLAINPLHTLLLAIVVSSLLLWITTIVDLDPYFKAKEEQYLQSTSAVESIASSSSISASSLTALTPTTVQSVVDQIIVETPAVVVVTEVVKTDSAEPAVKVNDEL